MEQKIRNEYDINVFFIQFAATSIRSTFTPNEDGSHTIFIDPRLAYNQQRKAYLHELEHIVFSDCHSAESANALEYKRHKKQGGRR